MIGKRILLFAAAFLATALQGPFQIEARAERGLTVRLHATEAPGAPLSGSVKLYGASHALVIGNDAYGGAWPRLSNAVKDAGLVAQALRDKGFLVTLKTNLTGREMEEVLKAFFYETGQDPEARLFLWYAGHGYSERDEGYLVPVDAPDPSDTGAFLHTALSLRRMGEFVRGANALHILSVFDSCFAGTIFNVGRAKPPPAITQATTRPVVQFLTSGDAGQEVSDDGTFRKLFVRALNGEVRADSNGDGYLAASELGLYMTNAITNYSNGGQTPRNGKINDPELDRGDFIFQISGPAQPPDPQPSSRIASDQRASDQRASELLFWGTIKDSTDSADFEDYIAQFPYGMFVSIAKRRITKLTGRSSAAPKAEPRKIVSLGKGVRKPAVKPVERLGTVRQGVDGKWSGELKIVYDVFTLLHEAECEIGIEIKDRKFSAVRDDCGSWKGRVFFAGVVDHNGAIKSAAVDLGDDHYVFEGRLEHMEGERNRGVSHKGVIKLKQQ